MTNETPKPFIPDLAEELVEAARRRNEQTDPVYELVELLHTDPEMLQGVPTNHDLIQEIKDANRPVKVEAEDLSPEERSGFLHMWRAGQVREAIAGLDDEELAELQEGTQAELDNLCETGERIVDLRFILQVAGSAQKQRAAFNRAKRLGSKVRRVEVSERSGTHLPDYVHVIPGGPITTERELKDRKVVDTNSPDEGQAK